MVWLVAVLVVALGVGTAGLLMLGRAGRPQPVTPPGDQPFHHEVHEAALEAETARMLQRVEAEMPGLMAQVEVTAAEIRDQVARGEAEASLMQEVDDLEDDPVEPPLPPVAASAQSVDFKMPARGRIWREDFVPADQEARYVRRGADGLPALRLVDAGDRLAIWSPADGGVLINPKTASLRKIGLYVTYARGAQFFPRAAQRDTLQAPGTVVELQRDPENEHDAHAVALVGPVGPFAWVQRGRAPAVSRHVDAREDFAAVCLREGVFLVGARTDLQHMLK